MDRKILHLFILYICLVTFCTSPIWLSGYFLNQDGSAHANSAWIMLRLVQDDTLYTELYRLNTFALPNSSGHWLLAALLLFVSSFAATKIMVTGIFAGTIAAAGFLRYKTVGSGVANKHAFAAAVSFNWLCLLVL